MNQWIADVYGTAGADDLEKTAQAHLLQKLAEEENIDLSQFSPEELDQLAAEVLSGGAAQQQQVQPGVPQQQQMYQQPQQGFQQAQPQQQYQQPAYQQGGFAAPAADPMALQKEAQAKFEEADLLGRVMAHAYTQELEKIAAAQKTAGKLDNLKGAAKGAFGKAQGAASSAAGKVSNFAKDNKKSIAAGAGGAAAGFAAGRASKKEKTASAFEKLAEMHAAEILGAAGYDPATGVDTFAQQQAQQSGQNQQPGQQPGQEAAGQAQEEGMDFQGALDHRALEMLQQAGYDTNEILARLQLSQQQPEA